MKMGTSLSISLVAKHIMEFSKIFANLIDKNNNYCFEFALF